VIFRKLMKNKKKNLFLSFITIIIGLVLLFIFLIPQQTYAAIKLPIIGTLIDFSTNTIFNLIGATLTVTQAIVGLLISFGAWLLEIVISLNIGFVNISGDTIAVTGWQVFRQIANLGFVLGIIIIAIATILRNRSYQAQQILWKLIVAALLVNFSLVIAGIFIDVSDVFSKYFINNIQTQGQSGLGKVLVGYINPGGSTGALVDAGEFEKALKTLGYSFKAKTFVIAGSLMSNIVSIIILVTLWVLMAQIFIRTFYILALLTISPIVWLSWVFPWGKRHWTNWWEHFLKWVFMLPINLLFIWIALSIMEKGKELSGEIVNKYVIENGGSSSLGPLSIMLGPIISPMMGVALLIMGMKIASRMGIYGSDAALKTATNVGNWAKGKASEYGGRAVAKGAKGVGVEKMGTKFSAWAGNKGWLAKQTVGRLGGVMVGAGITAEKKVDERFDEYKKKYSAKEWTDARIRSILAGLPTETERRGAISALAGKGKLNDEVLSIIGGGVMEAGQLKAIEYAQYLEKSGRKSEADAIYSSIGVDAGLYRARYSYNASRSGKIKDEVRSEVFEALRTGRLPKREDGTDATEDDALEIARMRSIKLDEEKLREERIRFDKKYPKAEDQKKIIKTLYSKKESELTDADRQEQIINAESIIADPSGGRFYGVLPAFDSEEKITSLLRNLVKAATKQSELSAKLSESFDKSFVTDQGGDRLRKEMIESGASAAIAARIVKQIKKSIGGDLGSGEFSAKPEKESSGDGGGNKDKGGSK